MSEAERTIAWRGHVAFALAVLAVAAVHLGLLWFFLPPHLALRDEVLAGGDMSTHTAQTFRVLEGLEGWGQTWVYDVQLLAGFPNGAIFDADNKGWEIWTWLGMKLGLSFARANNSFLIASHLLGPPIVFAAARLFGLRRWPALLAALFASLFWFFDSFTHWCWYIGMVEYDFSAYLCLIPLGLFYRFVVERRVWQAIAAALSLGAVLTVHPYTFVILAAPMTWLWLRERAALSKRDHALVLGIAVVAIAMNAWWLRVAFRFWHYILDSAYFGQSDPSYLVADVFGTLLDTETSGVVGTRASFRLLFVIAGLVQVVRWRKRGDRRGGLFGVALGTLLFITYFGTYIEVFAQIQPFRFVVPTGFLALIAASELVVALAGELRGGALDARAKLLVALLALPASQQLADDVLYFMPELRRQPGRLFNDEPALLSGSGYMPHPTLRYHPTDNDRQLVDWVDRHEDGRGRWLVEWPPLADEISWRTDAQVIGGLPFLNLQHSWANLWRRHHDGEVDDDELRTYLETYAISWVVVSFPDAYFNRNESRWLARVAIIGGHHVYRTKLAVNLIKQGGGKVVADTNVIRVTGSKPEVDVILRYHWLETLVCRPDCTLERTDADGVDPVGFIHVAAPHPADFEIVNGY